MQLAGDINAAITEDNEVLISWVGQVLSVEERRTDDMWMNRVSYACV